MIGAWLLVVAWMAAVAAVSLAPVRGPALEFVFGADKWAHVLFYAVLGWLGARAARRSGAPLMAAWAIAVSIAMLYGAGMEWLQGRVGRNASLADGIADLVGAVIGASILTFRDSSKRSGRAR